MSAPHVVHVTQPVEAGVARVVLDLLAEQQAAGWRTTLVSPEGWLAEQARDAGAAWWRWDAGRSPGPRVPVETRTLRGVLDAVAPDLVHLHSSKAGLAGRLALRGRVPTVFQPHAWSFAAASGPQRQAALRWERLAGRWTHLQLCCSEEERAEGRSAGVEGTSVLVPNGVDLERFAVAGEQARRDARARLGLGQGDAVAVCVGRLSRQKGQDVAVAAWPAVRAQVPGARLLLVGDGPERAHLTALAGEGVSVLGERDDVPDLLAAADVALLPSRWEGLALALLEAMARSRAVVATEVAGSPSTLVGGDLPPAGAVVPVDDPQLLAAALVQRLSDPDLAAAEGASGRRRVERYHDLRRTTAAVREACASLLSA